MPDQRDATVVDLEKRVQRLESMVWVVTALAVLLGLGGAGLWNSLGTARAKAEALEAKVKKLQEDADSVEKAAQQALARAREAEEKQFQAFVDSQRSGLLSGVVRRVERGTVYRDEPSNRWERRPDGNYYLAHAVTFDAPFSETPVILVSQTGKSGLGPLFINTLEMTSTGFRLEFQTWGEPLELVYPVRADWIALGH